MNDIDEVAVERVLAGDPPAHTTHAEKLEVVRRWPAWRDLSELEHLTGWNVHRLRRELRKQLDTAA